MQIGKIKLRRETPKILWDKHIRPLWDPRLRDNNIWSNRFLIITNNYCNQQCWSCSALCNTAFGSNPFRAKPETTPIENISKFLDLIEGYRPKHWIRLSGGEVTLCSPEYIEEIVELVHQHGRNISLLTNAARIDQLDPHLFDFIHLDEHIVNHDLIYSTAKHFKEAGFHRFQIWVTKEHRDLELQRTSHITQGLRCSAMMEAITLWRDIVYPCCVIAFLDGWNNNTLIRENQKTTGWSIDNPNLVETMENYINTLGRDTVYACHLQCWKDGPNLRYHPTSGDIEL